MLEFRIEIGGMGCDHCVRAVRSALERIDGLTIVDVSVGSAIVAMPDASLSGQVDEAIAAAGYEVVGRFSVGPGERT